jgi:type II secretory pathway pseudopilin PulG
MAGIARIVIGLFIFLLGLFFFITIIGLFIGLILIVIGGVLLASGASARGDTARMERQQEQTNLLLQQQMQLTAMQMNHPTVGPHYNPSQPGAQPGYLP